MRVIDFRKITALSEGDRLLVDGPKGTRSIEGKDLFGEFKLVKMTQAEYNALTTKDPKILYLLV